MTEHEENLWASGPHRRHSELFEAEYAKQLDRIARIRSEVSASLPLPPALPPIEELPRRETPQWDATPMNLAPEPPGAFTPDRGRGRAAGQATGVERRDDSPGVGAGAGRAPWRARRRAMAAGHEAGRNGDRPDGAAPARRAGAASRSGMPEDRGAGRHGDARDGGAAGAGPPRRREGGAAGAVTPRPQDGGAAGIFTPRRRVRALVAVAGLATLGAGAAALAGRAPESPARAVFHVPSQPTGLVASAGRVWVAGPAAGAVWILDGGSGRQAAPTLRVGGTPARVALDARFAWIADTERGAVVRAPRAGAGQQRLVRAGPDVADLIVAAGAVWTASSADGTVRVLDTDGSQEILHVGARPIALAADAGRVVAVDAGGTLSRLTARTRRVAGPPVELGGAPVDVALAGDHAWVADALAGTIRGVALSTGRVGPPVRVGGSPVAIAADAAGIYVLCRGDRTLVVLDAAGAVRSRVSLAHAPTALALDPHHVWIAAGNNEVIRVDR